MTRRYRHRIAPEPLPPLLGSRQASMWLAQVWAVDQVTQESKSLVACVHPNTSMLRVEKHWVCFLSMSAAVLWAPKGPGDPCSE